MKTLAIIACLIVAVFNSFNVLAGITYEGTNIVVSNYPASAPATLSDIRAADTAGGWGIVQYDPATDTTTLSNYVLIGGAYGANTFLQIGRTNFPTETLVMHGSLRVKAASAGCMNGLLLGTSITNTVQPALKFDCSTLWEYGMYFEYGMVMTSYNALVTSTSTNRTKGWIGTWVGYAGPVYMTNTTFSNCGYLYPFDLPNSIVVNSTFANAPFAVKPGVGYMEGCTFSNIDEAIKDNGSIEITLVGCTFVTNLQNWTLRYTDMGIRAVDCWIGAPRSTNITCQRYQYPGESHWHYPTFMAQRHFVVNVTNSAGAPIANATVTVSNEQHDADAVIHGRAVTGTNGLTPAIDSKRALFVMDYMYRATTVASQPLYEQYTYTLTTTAPGYGTNILTGVDPSQNWTTQAVMLTP